MIFLANLLLTAVLDIIFILTSVISLVAKCKKWWDDDDDDEDNDDDNNSTINNFLMGL